MKHLVIIIILFLSCTVNAINDQKNDTLKNILIITCHPDDWEISMAGTAYLLKDKYHIHVIIYSDGELGNTWNTTGIPDPVMGAKRVEDSNQSAAKINATNHFLKMPDGNVFADKEAVDKTISLLRGIDPAIVFIHWPIDKPDHAAAAAMALMALSKTGMMYNREVYFFEVGDLNHFIPAIFVDVTPVWDIKKEIVHLHERYNDDRFYKMAEERALYHGTTNHSKYAEGFIPLFPLSNKKYNNKTGCCLMDL